MKFRSYSTRVMVFGLISFCSVVFFCGILLISNYLSYRHYVRKDLTESKVYSIDEKSKNIILSVKDNINIYIFFPNSSRLYPYIKFTVDEFSRLNPNINAQYIDVDKDLLKVQEYTQKFKLDDKEYIVVEKGEIFKALNSDDIAEYDYQNSMETQQEPALKGFKGEEAIVSAILSIVEDKRVKIYFVKGHGEKDINDYKGELGYAKAHNALRHNNYNVDTIMLAESKEIPSDASLLIVAGAQKQFTRHEIDLIRYYLDQGKPLFYLTDPKAESGLNNLMKSYGVIIGDDVVIDPSQSVPFSDPSYIIANIIESHPITNQLENMMGMFFISCSVTPDTNINPDIKITPLVQTTQDGWGESEITKTPIKKDENTDLNGPVPITVAVEKLNKRPLRMVIFGDSDFASNSQIGNLANSDLFINSVNWLLQEDTNIGISPKVFDRKIINISNKDMNKLSIIVLFFLPSLSLAMGIAVWLIRRK